MVYYILTLIYTVLIPFTLQMVALSCAGNVYMPLSAVSVLMLIPSFFAMLLYGYVITKAQRPRKPNSMFGIYLPMVLPLIWYLFVTGIANIFEFYGDLEALMIGIFFTFTVFGTAVTDSLPGFGYWHYILLLNLLYYLVIFLGFGAGERLAAYRMKVERKPFKHHRKIILSLMMIILCFYAFSEYVLYRHRINIVPSAHPSYNFSYAGGYSSIDLRPYDVTNHENILVKLTEPSSFRISNPQKMPVLDGAEAAYPVYSAFANACYENIATIQKKAENAQSDDTVMPIQFTNTIYAYEKLLEGEIDIFFGAKPSANQLEMAEKAGVELRLTPIAKEAFVFLVSDENPVDGLSSEQIRDIYSGEINNWRNVGGRNLRILPFQRPKNSGSQTMMEYFMGDTPLREPLEAESTLSMGDLVQNVAAYENSASSLGYSFRYYTTIMMSEADSEEVVAGIKLLAVDGIYPDSETIRSGEYPYTTELYAITLADNPKETVNDFVDWMTGPQGQQIVEETGYVALP